MKIILFHAEGDSDGEIYVFIVQRHLPHGLVEVVNDDPCIINVLPM